MVSLFFATWNIFFTMNEYFCFYLLIPKEKMDLLHKYNISLVVGSVEYPGTEIIVKDDHSAVAVAIGMYKFRREPVALVLRDASSLPDEIRDYPIVVFSDSIPDASPVFPAVLDRSVLCPLNHNGPFVYQEDPYDPNHGVLTRAFIEASLRPVIVLGLHHDPLSILAWVMSRNIPIVATESTLDLIPSTHNLFIGRLGMDGDRAGNFAVQNADVIIVFGKIENHPFFAREAHVIQVGRRSNPCHAHVPSLPDDLYVPRACREWIDKCRNWKQKWTNELSLDNGFSPYIFLSLFYQSFSSPKVVVTHKDPKAWYHPVYHQSLIGSGDRFLLSPTEDVISFISGIDTDLPIFVFLGAGRFFSMDEFDRIRNRNIFIICMRRDTEETTLSHEQYSSRTPADRAWYLDEVGEAIGIPYVSLDSSTVSDIFDLHGMAPYLVDVFFTDDFTPSPFGRPDLPLEEMIPSLHDHASEMLIAPVNP